MNIKTLEIDISDIFCDHYNEYDVTLVWSLNEQNPLYWIEFDRKVDINYFIFNVCLL